MPIVPTYQPGQVQSQPIQAPRRTNYVRGAMGAVQGQALAGVGDTLLDIGLNEQRKADDTQLLEANRKLLEWEIENFDKPGSGALSKTGKEALSLPDTVVPAYDKYRSEIEGTLNDRVKGRFRPLAEDRRGDITRKLYSHVSKQSDAMLAAEVEASEQIGLSSIATNWRDPNRVEREGELLAVSQRAALERVGASSTVIKAKQDELQGKIAGTVLDSMLNDREYERAIAFYDSNKALFGTKADEFGAKVQQARYAYEETRETDKIISQYGAGPAGIAAARDIADPVLRERVESRIDREQIRVQRAQEMGEKSLREGGWARVEAAPPGASLGEIFSPSEMAALARQPGLVQTFENRLTSRLKGLEIQTDPREYDRLQRMALTDPTGFQQYDLSKSFGKLSPASLDELNKKQADMRDPAKAPRVATEANLLSNWMEGTLRIPPGAKSYQQRAQAERAYYDRKQQFISQNKREPNDSEQRELMRELSLPVIQRRDWLPDRTMRTYQVPPEEAAQFKPDFEAAAKEVPATDRLQIIEAYRTQYQRDPTPDEVMREYLGGR